MRAPRERESRPGGGGSSLHAARPIVLRDAIAALADELDWYESGVMRGIEMGRQQVVDEWHAVRADGGRVARMIAASTPYAELCEQRGEPERAARQRQILADRGVTR